MPRFIELANDKNATEFQTELHSAIAEKVESALESRKSEMAASLFATPEAPANE